MRHKYIPVLIVILVLAASAAAGIIFYDRSETTVSGSAVGTYKTSGYDAVYYVLDDEGMYCRYEQYSILEKGSYKADGNSISLSSGKKLTLEDRKLYDESGDVYEKFSDTPTYVNVDIEEK